MPFVQAKCPNCGGFLAVDNTKDAAVCQFCSTPFIIEKAINNYNISINNNISVNQANIKIEGAPTVDNLIKRAMSFEKQGNIYTALEYYEKVLDLDINNMHANKGIKRITKGAFFSEPAQYGLSYGTLSLVKDYILFVKKNGKQINIPLKNCLEAKSSIASFYRNINIVAKKEIANTNLSTNETFIFNIMSKRKNAAKDWVQIINNAIKGIYPSQI